MFQILSSWFRTVICQFFLLSGLMTVAWFVLKFLYPNNPRLRVMGLYGCTHKSVATGIPLIDAIYGTYKAVGLYTLPVLIWHPMQLLLGTILSPYLTKWVESEQKRLNLDDRDVPLLPPVSSSSTTPPLSSSSTTPPVLPAEDANDVERPLTDVVMEDTQVER
jgi:SBF-like CPA transporter family (DUF4137)